MPSGTGIPTPSTAVLVAVPWSFLPTITVTRPNNVTAYVAGGVFGAAADARIEIPNVGSVGHLINLRIKAVLNDGTGSPAMNAVFFVSQPPTVLGDQAALALTDSDITLIPNIDTNALGVNLNFAGGAGSLAFYNITAGAAGRRATIIQQAPIRLTTTSLWMYIFLSAAYTPLANGVLTLMPAVQRVG